MDEFTKHAPVTVFADDEVPWARMVFGLVDVDVGNVASCDMLRSYWRWEWTLRLYAVGVVSFVSGVLIENPLTVRERDLLIGILVSVIPHLLSGQTTTADSGVESGRDYGQGPRGNDVVVWDLANKFSFQFLYGFL